MLCQCWISPDVTCVHDVTDVKYQHWSGLQSHRWNKLTISACLVMDFKINIIVICFGVRSIMSNNKETPALPLHFLDLFTSLHNVKVIKQKLGKCCFFFIVD